MTIQVTHERGRPMAHTVQVRQHRFTVDEPVANGGEDAGLTPHEVYDSALGACKAMTVLWYARRKQMPLEAVEATVERDDSDERRGTYRLTVQLRLGGPLSEAQRQELLKVAEKCPIHKLMTQATTEVQTLLLDTPAAGT
jgi:putative redox protein